MGFSKWIEIIIRDNDPSCTLWLFNIAMENGPFVDDFPIKTSIYGNKPHLPHSEAIAGSYVIQGFWGFWKHGPP